MAAKVEFGHKWSLHKVGEKPENGFGYPNADHLTTQDEVQALADEWNNMPADKCPHTVFLDKAKCGLCGYKYLVTTL